MGLRETLTLKAPNPPTPLPGLSSGQGTFPLFSSAQPAGNLTGTQPWLATPNQPIVTEAGESPLFLLNSLDSSLSQIIDDALELCRVRRQDLVDDLLREHLSHLDLGHRNAKKL